MRRESRSEQERSGLGDLKHTSLRDHPLYYGPGQRLSKNQRDQKRKQK